MERYDVVILGSGQAGSPLAWRLARAGRRVALVERGHLGGTCVNEGCTPTKTFLASAEAAYRARSAAAFGVDVGDVAVDMARVVARKDQVVETWRAGVAANVEKAAPGLELVRGHARFVGERTVEVGSRRLVGDVVVVNTGARARIPELPGLDQVSFLDNRTAMELTTLPGHLLVLGGGYVGCELGQAYRRFGADVTLVQSGPHLLPREDEDVSQALEDAFRDEGISLALGARATEVAGDGTSVTLTLADGSRLTGSHLLVAVGRVPATDDLGAEAGGVALDGRGFIQVDDEYRTSATGVYAVGDCTGGPQFTHTSWDDHRILFDILAGEGTRTRSGRLVPHATFTDPQVARVGLTEREAVERGVAHEVATLPFRAIARAYETGQTPGLVKVLVSPEDERILGACVVGSQGGELVTVYQMLMAAGAPASVLVDSQVIHPTFAEGLQTAVMRLPRYRLS